MPRDDNYALPKRAEDVIRVGFLNLTLRLSHSLELLHRTTQNSAGTDSLVSPNTARNIFRPDRFVPSYTGDKSQKSNAFLRKNVR